MTEPREVPDRLTPATPAEVARALANAWRSLGWGEPARESILVLLAQGALETGRWKSCHCWNLGNAKSVPGDGRSWTFFRCNEILNGREVWFDPPHPACRFRAYDTLDEGAVDYLVLLRRRFASAWPAVLAGDPAGFVRALKAARYFTAALEPYVRAVVSLTREFSALPLDLSPPAPEGLTDADRAAVEALVARTIYDAQHAGELDARATGDAATA